MKAQHVHVPFEFVKPPTSFAYSHCSSMQHWWAVQVIYSTAFVSSLQTYLACEMLPFLASAFCFSQSMVSTQYKYIDPVADGEYRDDAEA